MAEVVNLLNSAGEAFVAWAVRMLIQSSVLIGVVAALDFISRRRVKAVVRYWVWLLVLVKLILPPSLSAPTGLAYWFGDRLAHVSSAVAPPVVESEPRAAADSTALSLRSDLGPGSSAARVSQPASAKAEPVHWQAIVLGLWVVFVAVMIILLIRRAVFVRALVTQSHEPPQAVTGLLAQCSRRMGVRTRLTVRLSPQWASPSVCGIRRPVILIPEEMYGRLSPNELRSILLHELAHVARGDLWLNLVQALLQVAYFFHPLLWLANAQIRRVREQAVDETVLAAMGDEAEDYPRTLISVSKLAFGSSSLSLRLLGVVESKKELTDRIRRIASRPFPKTARLGLAGLLLVMFVAVTLLPMALPAPGRPAAAAPSADNVSADGLAGTERFVGEVSDPNGQPVAGARVAIFPDQDWTDFKQKPVVSRADGGFAFDGLAGGSYLMRPVPPEEGVSELVAEPATVSAQVGQTLTGVKVELGRGGVLEVVVTEADTKAPVEKAYVSVEPTPGQAWSSPQSGKDGTARLCLMPGQYRVNALKDGYEPGGQPQIVTIREGRTAHVECILAGWGRIKGVVLDPEGRPVKGARVAVIPSTGPTQLSGEDGAFEVIGPRPAGASNAAVSYLVGRYVRGNLAAAQQIGEGTRVMDIHLVPGVTFTGRVVDADGNGISNAGIELMLRRRYPLDPSSTLSRADVHGRFEIKAIPAHQEYSIEASADGYGLKTVEAAADAAEDGRLDVGMLRLAIPDQSVAGVVVDVNDKPVAGARVMVHSAVQPFCSTETDANGLFRMERICAGRIDIIARKEGQPPAVCFIQAQAGDMNIRLTISEKPSPGQTLRRQMSSLKGKPLPDPKPLGLTAAGAEQTTEASAPCERLLRGTYTWDIDTDSYTQDESSDIFWEQVNEHERYIVPFNGARCAVLKGKTFDRVDSRDLKAAAFTDEPISASDEGSTIDVGTVLAVRTNGGNYAKVLVVGFVPRFGIAKYDMRLRYVLYRKQRSP
jgi:beta-lactamase regulating signal transducer with metallopeptidase domain